MKLVRALCRLAVLASALCGAGVALAADGLESEIERAEERLSHAAQTDPHQGNPNTDPLSIDPDLAICTVLVFLILMAVLWKFAWGPILAGLEKREHKIADDIAEAKRQREEADALVGKYEARLAAAADEVRGILDEARRNAEGLKASILAEAKQGAEAERMRSLHEIELATDGALRSLAERSAELAVDLAGKIVRHSLTPADQSRLVSEAVERFQVTPSKN